MRKTVLGISLLMGTALPMSARQFVAGDVAGVKLKRSGKIVISNDDTTIRARHYSNSVETTLVELRSMRLRPAAPVAAPVANAPATAPAPARSR